MSQKQILESQIYFLTFYTMKGVIKKLNEKGFGFITPEDGGKDVFFHANDCSENNFATMQEGQAVTFEMGTSPKGPKATGVMLADGGDMGA